MRHIRPWELFQYLGEDRKVSYRIPEMAGIESLTVFALETLILVAAVRITKSESVLEIGTSWGYTAFHLASNTSAFVTTVDIEAKPHYAWTGEPCEERITPVIWNSHSLTEMGRDMIFIDGDHSYEAVKADSQYALGNAQKVIGWHDYGNPDEPGVMKYLDESELDLVHIMDSWIVLWFKDGL